MWSVGMGVAEKSKGRTRSMAQNQGRYNKTNRTRVADLRKSHPDWTLQRIGNTVGVTKERVRQLLKLQGLPTRGVRLPRYPQE